MSKFKKNSFFYDIKGIYKKNKKLKLRVNKISASAQEAIDKAGGQVVLLKKKDS